MLAVGAPSRKSGDLFNAGGVFLYNLSSSTGLDFTNHRGLIKSENRASRFGK